jgi:hypothetical protein
MKSISSYSLAALAASFALTSALGCKPRTNKTAVTSVASAEESSSSVQSRSALATGVPKHMPKDVADSLTFRVLVGPQLLIQPSKGIGPIRFGATADTIERLMETKPTESVEADDSTVMRYQSHAVEFTLQDGALVKVYLHGNEREFTLGKGLDVTNLYGIFNGSFFNGGKLGMYAKYVDQGQPERVEKVDPGRYPTLERHHYSNMVLEYDRLQNGNVVLAGVILTKPGWTEPDKAPKRP